MMELHAVCHDCKRRHRIDEEPQGIALYWSHWVHAKHAGHRVEIVPVITDWKQYDPNADIKIAYASSANQTVTNLNGLAASATHVAGWESGAVDNSTNLYLDYRVTAKITVESTGVTAGEIKLWLVGELDDSNWPDVFDGTESAETVTDTEIRDAICHLGTVTTNDTTASRVYYLDCPSAAAVFGGNTPRKFVVFITQNTGTTLETTGNQVTVKGSYLTG